MACPSVHQGAVLLASSGCPFVPSGLFLSPRKLGQWPLSQVNPGWASQCSEQSLRKACGPLVLTSQHGGVENMVNWCLRRCLHTFASWELTLAVPLRLASLFLLARPTQTFLAVCPELEAT